MAQMIGEPAPADPAPMSSPPRVIHRARRPRLGPRRTRVVIRRFGVWSVLRFSLLFNFCVMLILYLALAIIWVLVSAIGGIESLEKLLGWLFAVGQNNQAQPMHINGVALFVWLFLAGGVAVVLWSLITVFVAYLYNLISDVVGGVEVTLAERGPRDDV